MRREAIGQDLRKEEPVNFETIIYEKKDGVGIIRLNRPERMNAVIEQMYKDLQSVLVKAGSDNEVKVLVLTGSFLKKGDKIKHAFCAGADLKKHDSGDRTFAQKKTYIEEAHETTRLMHVFPKPIIAAVNGAARGAGVEMALCCDFILMAKEATVAFSETGLGTLVGGGSTYHLPRLIGTARAKELVYTGRVINGSEAADMGLALNVYPREELMNRALEMANIIAGKAPVSIRLAKERLGQSFALDLSDVLRLETDGILSCMKTKDWSEGLRSFAEKRKPDFIGK